MHKDNINYIYAVKDCLVGEFFNLFVCPNDAVAKRAFAQSINTSDHPLRVNYRDIDFYRIGSFSLVTGAILQTGGSLDNIEFLCHGTDVYNDIPVDFDSKTLALIEAKARDIIDDEYERLYKSKHISEGVVEDV